MPINIWTLDSDENPEEWEALSQEQKELVIYAQKAAWEGGNLELWHHSGDAYFPAAVRREATTFGLASDALDRAIYEYAKELDIQL